ncbi:hypothetical protein B0H14DRAFT_2559212 [Mycena olivaceomarginata]|nr:hypothetical protein B0H14DRAFT_2559212 [Mycena olivaceomarginata]
MTTVNAGDVFASAMPLFTIAPNPPRIHPPPHTPSTSQQQLHDVPNRVNIAKGSDVTIKYIIEKGSAAVEAFREVSHQFARTFEFVDRARRHKEVDVGQDLRLLTETMLDARLHVLTGNRPVYVLLKVNKRGDVATGPRVSANVDLLETGTQALHGGKFKEFIRSTAWDPASGYPVGTPRISSDTDDPLVNGSVFDHVDENLLARDRFNDVDDGDTHEQHYLGLGSLDFNAFPCIIVEASAVKRKGPICHKPLIYGPTLHDAHLTAPDANPTVPDSV